MSFPLFLTGYLKAGEQNRMDSGRATSKEIDRISEEFLGTGPFGIMTNPLTFASQTLRSAERTANAPSVF
jgi:hypothetical protein